MLGLLSNPKDNPKGEGITMGELMHCCGFNRWFFIAVAAASKKPHPFFMSTKTE